MLNYYENVNKVVVYGCSTCPFLKDESGDSVILKPYCSLNKEIETVVNEDNLWAQTLYDDFPENCPIKDPNFKFTRVNNGE